jgi:hypothetical protein
MKIGRSRGLSGIPKVTLQGRHPVQEVDSRDRPLPRTYSLFDALVCTYQPYVGYDLKVLEDGFNTTSIYKVFTDTECVVGQEGTTELSDELNIGSKWFKVVKSQPWQVGVRSHYCLTVVEIDEVNNG